MTVVRDESHPRPLLARREWVSLDGGWRFAVDHDDRGLADRWYESADPFDRDIRVPFVPESPASGIGDDGPYRVVWYRRELAITTTNGRRVLLHFGAVDQDATVWVDGRMAGTHRGGQTAFRFDVTDLLGPGERHVLTVRVVDDADDPDVPRGKQDWRPEPHFIWYRRSTGIWKTVWLEEVAAQHIASLQWTGDASQGAVTASVRLAAAPGPGTRIGLAVRHGRELLGEVEALALGASVELRVPLATLQNAQERESLEWSPENPVLLDAEMRLTVGSEVLDEVSSYVALRDAAVGSGRFLLNGRPYFVRAVLDQGYWPTSQLTPPDDGALRRDVELIKELGFNAVRIHQKVEDERFLYWADRLGLLVWAETAAAYAFSPRAVERLTTEWLEIVAQQRSHPCVVTWVPFNESWGVQEIRRSPAQQQFVQALAALTRAIDPTRPVVSNDGWEHVDSDILTVHDYATDAAVLAAHYVDDHALADVVAGPGPQGRAAMATGSAVVPDAPVILSEFGGIAFAAAGTWGYAVADSESAFQDALSACFAAVLASPVLAGICYTQFTDTLQEANGLLTEHRLPKLPIETLRAIITGSHDPSPTTGEST